MTVEPSKLVLKSEIPPKANILTTRFVHAIKLKAIGEIVFKVQYVIGGRKDSLKNYIAHGSQTLQIASIRLLLALASMFASKSDQQM